MLAGVYCIVPISYIYELTWEVYEFFHGMEHKFITASDRPLAVKNNHKRGGWKYMYWLNDGHNYYIWLYSGSLLVFVPSQLLYLHGLLQQDLPKLLVTHLHCAWCTQGATSHITLPRGPPFESTFKQQLKVVANNSCVRNLKKGQ